MPCGRSKAMRSMRRRYGRKAGTRAFHAVRAVRRGTTRRRRR